MTSRFTLGISAALFMLSGVLSFTAAANAAGVDVSKITRGNVSFSQDGNRLVVRASNGSIIEYNRFSVEAGQIMQFIQPSSTSRVLNRVTGAELSRIDGSLLSNGIVYLVNPQGIRMGNGALINVGGFYAAAGAMSDNDFIRGQNNFTNLSGKVTNEGMIQAQSVALVGQYVANHGIIHVDDGMVAMAAGDTVYLQNGSAPIMVTVSRSQLGADGSGAGTQAAVTNTGTINAGKGKVAMASGDFYALAMDLSGTIIGKSIEARGGAGNAPGNGGVVAVNGTLDASSSTDKGGTIDLFGDRVGLFGNALVNANGATGGGNVRIGGDYLGSNAANAPQATATYIDSNARVSANATQNGDGGRVIVWSNEYTGFFGTIEASAVGIGNGGFVETSSHDNLQAFGSVNAKAARGKAGTWLMDPSDVTITNSADAGGSFNSASPNVFTPNSATATVNVATVNTSLNGGTSVTINTGSVGDGLGGAGNITLAAAIAKTTGGDATLELNAVGSITLNDSITSTVGALSVALNAGATVSTGAITTNGGSVSVNAGGGVIIAGNITAGGTGEINITGNTNVNLALRSDVGVTVNSGVTIRTTNGNLIITGTGGSNVDGSNHGVYNLGGTITSGGAGNVVVMGTGGTVGSFNDGVYNRFDDSGPSLIYGVITSTGSGTVTVTGQGGACGIGSRSNDGIINFGIISSGGGDVFVTGTGGTGDGGVIRGIDNIGTITSGGAGNVTVTGIGGSGGGTLNDGILNFIWSTIRSGGAGYVQVTGTGGGGASGGNNRGVKNVGGTITSGGGDVTVIGFGGAGSAGSNYGVSTHGNSGATGTITSGGGNVTVEGTSGTGGTNNDAILIDVYSLVAAPGDLTLISNGGAINQTSGTITVVGTTTITAGTSPTFFDVTLAQSTNDFGGAVSVVSANNVSLADANALTLGASTVQNDFTATASGGVVVAGNITAGGTGEINITGNTNVDPDLRSDTGVTVNSGVTIQTTNGDLNITGTGGSVGGYNSGVYNYGTITSGGAGNVVVMGTGGSGAPGYNVGVYNFGPLFGTGGIITSGGIGSVTVTGIGGTGGSNNYGVINSFGLIKSGDSGAVTVTGTGGNGPGGVNLGVLNLRGTITSDGNGSVTVTGMAGSGLGGSNYGVYNRGGIITTSGGDVTVVGIGGTGDGGENYGVVNTNPSSSYVGTITAGGSGDVTVEGTGGTGGSDNDAIIMDIYSLVAAPGDLTLISNGGAINQTSGTITVVGTTTITAGTSPTFFDVTLAQSTNDFGGAVSVVSANNVSLADINALTLGASTVENDFTATASGGIVIAGDITAGGTGEINITGNTNVDPTLRSTVGVSVNAFVTIQSTDGDLNITGTGGTDAGGFNIGVVNVGTITSSGSGSVKVTGTGGMDDDGFNFGVYNYVTITSGGTGRVTVTGTGGSGYGYNFGVGNLGTITSGGGDVFVTGTGGSGDGGFNRGALNYGTITSSGAGGVAVTGMGGSGGSNNDAIYFMVDNVITAPRNLELTSLGGAINQTSGTITVVGTTTITANAPNTDISLADGANNFASTVTIGGTASNVRDFKLRNINATPGVIANLSSASNLRDFTIIYNNAFYALPSLPSSSLHNVNIMAAGISSIGGTTLTTHNGGTVTLNSTREVAIAPGANIVADGAVQLTGTDGIFIAGNVTTTGDSVTFNSQTTMTDGYSVSIDTTNGGFLTGADIFFGAAVKVGINNSQALNLNAGTSGDITLTGDVGSTTFMLSNLTLKADDTTIIGNIYVAGNTTAGDITIINDTIIESFGSLTVGSINGGGYAVNISTVDLILTAPITNVTTFTIQNSDPTGAITLMGSGGLSIDQTDWNFIGAGVNVVLGGANYTGTVTVDGAWTNNRSVTIDFMPGGTGHVYVDHEITGSGSLTINGSGHTTTLAADITQTAIHIADAVEVDAPLITLTATAGDITIDGAIIGVNGGESLSLAATGDITLGGDIGNSVGHKLMEFRVDCGNDVGDTITFTQNGQVVAAEIVALNCSNVCIEPGARVMGGDATSTLDAPATMATIVALGDIEFNADDFRFGQNHKLTGFGDITIGGFAAPNSLSVTFGDVNAVGDLRVNANSITLLGRAGGPIATNTGGVVNDPQVDYVVGGRVYFSVAPIMGGSNPGNRAVFSNPTGNVDALGTLGAYSKSVYPTAITSTLLSGAGGATLDLGAASGVSYINPAVIIPQAMSSMPPIGLLGDADTLDDEDDAAAPVADDQTTEPISTPTQTEKTATDVPVNAIGTAVPVALR